MTCHGRHRGRSLISTIVLLHYEKQNWSQFFLAAKVTALKQQTSKFYLQIQRTDAGYRIYVSRRPVVQNKHVDQPAI